MKVISKKQLLYNLCILKQISSYIDKNELKNIHFINIISLCDYLDNKSNKKYNSLEVLNEIYKYIPINVYYNIELYILLKNGLNSINIEYIKNIKKIIYVKTIYFFLTYYLK